MTKGADVWTRAEIEKAREAVVAAARVWAGLKSQCESDQSIALLEAIYTLNQLEATDQAGEASPRAPEVRDGDR